MWLLHLLPSSLILFVVYTLLVLGLVGFLVALFLRASPFVNIYRIPIQILSVILICAGIYFYGGYTTEMIWREKVEKLQTRINEIEKKSPIITKEIVTKYKDKIVIVGRQVDVIKKEIEIQKEVINEGCKLNPTAVEMYNRGITGEEK